MPYGEEMWCAYCNRDHGEEIDARPKEDPKAVLARKCGLIGAYGLPKGEFRAYTPAEIRGRRGKGYTDRKPPEGKYPPPTIEKTEDGLVKRYLVMKRLGGKPDRWELATESMCWTAAAAEKKAIELGEAGQMKKMLVVQITVPG